MDSSPNPVDAYLAGRGALNVVLFLVMSLAAVAAAAGLVLRRGRDRPAYAEPPVFAPVLRSQRGPQEPARDRGSAVDR